MRRSPGHSFCTDACRGFVFDAGDNSTAWVHARDELVVLYDLDPGVALGEIREILGDAETSIYVRALALRALPDFHPDPRAAAREVLDWMGFQEGPELLASGAAALLGCGVQPSGVYVSTHDRSGGPLTGGYYRVHWRVEPASPDPSFPGRTGLRAVMVDDRELQERFLTLIDRVHSEKHDSVHTILRHLRNIRTPFVDETVRNWLARPDWRDSTDAELLEELLDVEAPLPIPPLEPDD